MRNIAILIVCTILLTSIASAEIIINKQPDKIYNLGELISLPTTIKTLTDVSSSFDMNIICNGHNINFYKNGIGLPAGGEKKLEPSLILTKELIGKVKGNCKIKATLGSEYILTNDFKISDVVTIHSEIDPAEIFPGENIILEGGATKESGKDVNGFIEIQVIGGNASSNTSSASIRELHTIDNGFFFANISTLADMKAGGYTIKLYAYEKDPSGEMTNQGFTREGVLIKQLETNLEIFLENPEVEPGTNVKIKPILHDQTGENILKNSTITVKDSNDKIREKIQVPTGEFFEFPIAFNEFPAEFTILASAGDLTSETIFNIQEKEDIKIQLINRTLIIINTGNMPYCNKSLLVKIGESPLNLDVCLEVNEEQKYELTAPEGEYKIEIISEGEESIIEHAILTGKAVDIKEISGGVGTLARYPFVWIFVMFLLGFIVFTVYKKGYKRSFIGRMNIGKKKGSKTINLESEKAIPLRSKSLVQTKSKAELSLSIKGDKQNISLIGLKIKNLREIESKKTNAEETLQKIVHIAEEHKAAIYENQDHIFFLFAPIKTKTFKNEKTAIEIANKAKSILAHHNKMFKQKIEFGISLNYGTIIAKQEPNALKFMSMGTLITTAKRISTLSNEEILLSEKIKENLPSGIKTEKKTHGKINVYTVKQIKESQENHKFISSFLERIEHKKE